MYGTIFSFKNLTKSVLEREHRHQVYFTIIVDYSVVLILIYQVYHFLISIDIYPRVRHAVSETTARYIRRQNRLYENYCNCMCLK